MLWKISKRVKNTFNVTDAAHKNVDSEQIFLSQDLPARLSFPRYVKEI
jgi:hypothetical protein